MSETILLDNNAILSKIIFEKKKNKNKFKTKNLDLDIYNETEKSIKNDENDKDNNVEDDILIDIKCINCNSKNIIIMDGFNICNDCGLYNDCIIDCGQEWRFYGNDDSKGSDPARCDIPTNELLPNTSIGSLIGFSSKDCKNSKRIRNMNFWNGFSYRDSSLLETFNNITIMAQNAGISYCIIEEAKYMYKQVSEIKSSRRTKKEAMKAGCIMLACKLKGVPRNCTEIAEMFKLKNNKTFRKSIKTFEEIWKNIKLGKHHDSEKLLLEKQLLEKAAPKHLLKKQLLEKPSPKQLLEKAAPKQLLEKAAPKDNDNDSDSDNESESDRDSDSDSDSESDRNSDSNSDSESDSESDLDSDSESDLDSKREDKENSENKLNTGSNKNIQECITKLHRFVCALGLSDRVFEACKIILIYIENKKYLDKHTPLSRTSTIIYYIIERLGISINKHNILQTCEISQVTINKCYQKLMKFKIELENIKI